MPEENQGCGDGYYPYTLTEEDLAGIHKTDTFGAQARLRDEYDIDDNIYKSPESGGFTTSYQVGDILCLPINVNLIDEEDLQESVEEETTELTEEEIALLTAAEYGAKLAETEGLIANLISMLSTSEQLASLIHLVGPITDDLLVGDEILPEIEDTESVRQALIDYVSARGVGGDRRNMPFDELLTLAQGFMAEDMHYDMYQMIRYPLEWDPDLTVEEILPDEFLAFYDTYAYDEDAHNDADFATMLAMYQQLALHEDYSETNNTEWLWALSVAIDKQRVATLLQTWDRERELALLAELKSKIDAMPGVILGVSIVHHKNALLAYHGKMMARHGALAALWDMPENDRRDAAEEQQRRDNAKRDLLIKYILLADPDATLNILPEQAGNPASIDEIPLDELQAHWDSIYPELPGTELRYLQNAYDIELSTLNGVDPYGDLKEMGLFFLSLTPVIGTIFEVVDNVSLLMSGNIPGLLFNLIDPLNLASRMTRSVKNTASNMLDSLSDEAKKQYKNLVDDMKPAVKELDKVVGKFGRFIMGDDWRFPPGMVPIRVEAGAGVGSRNGYQINNGDVELRVVFTLGPSSSDFRNELRKYYDDELVDEIMQLPEEQQALLALLLADRRSGSTIKNNPEWVRELIHDDAQLQAYADGYGISLPGPNDPIRNPDDLVYERHGKHDETDATYQGPRGDDVSDMDLSDEDALDVLKDSYLIGKKRYGLKDGIPYAFHYNNQGKWHGWRIKDEHLSSIPTEVLRLWRETGQISSAKYNKWINNTPK